jgi:hypothetical protein
MELVISTRNTNEVVGINTGRLLDFPSTNSGLSRLLFPTVLLNPNF